MDELYASETLLRPDERKSVCGYTPCLIDRNKIPFKELWKEASCFADDIVCAVGTDFMQKIAEAEHRFICDLLNRLQQMEVVDAEPVVRCEDCIRRYDTDECPMCHLIEGQWDEYTFDDGYCDRGERVFRCKDCTWWNEHEDECADANCCLNPYGLNCHPNPDDYCSYGERRANNG